MKTRKKPQNLLLPSLDPDLAAITDPKQHKPSKSVSFPQINASTSVSATKPDLRPDGSLLKTIDRSHNSPMTADLIALNNKAYHSPMRRLINFAGKAPKRSNVSTSNRSLQDLIRKVDSSADFSIQLSKRDLVLHWSRVRNSRRILDHLLENLWLSFKLNSLKLLTDTLYLIGDLHLCDGNIEGALYSYLHMKILCDLTQNFKMKLHSILALANCCKIMKRNTEALFLYKKALEYVWIVQDEESESKIYDRIGMIYFHFGEIRKARYYHDRSLEYKLESEISPSKYSSSKALMKYHESLNAMKFDSVSPILLGKLGISFIETVQNTAADGNSVKTLTKTLGENQPIPKVKFGTNLNLEALMENIFFEKDFSYEIPSPRYPRGYTQQDVLLGRTDVVGVGKRPKGASSDMVFSLGQLNLINTNSDRNRKPMVKIDLDPMSMKIPIAEKIKLRNQIVRHLKTKETIWGNKLSSKKKIKSSELLGFGLFYNHLTPNRNLEAFNYHFKNKTNKLSKYYHNLLVIEDQSKQDSEMNASLEDIESIVE